MLMNLVELAKAKGVTVSEIREIILEWRISVGPSQKLTEQEVAIISKRLDQLKNPDLGSYFGSLKSRFGKVVQTIKYLDYPPIRSHFSDEDAISLCSRVYDKPTNQLAKKFSKDTQNEEYKYSIHKVAENALAFYGGLLLTFVLGLKVFSSPDPAMQLYIADTSDTSEFNFSLRDLVFKNDDNEELTITFKRKTNFSKASDFGFAILRRNKKGRKEPIYCLTPSGFLLKSFIDKIPALSLFASPSGGTKDMYFGYTSAECFVCGRELTDPGSIIYGIGPSCRASYPLFFS